MQKNPIDKKPTTSPRLSRRQFTTAGLVAGAALSSGRLAAQSPASPLETRYLMELALDIGDNMDTGHTRIAPVTGGSFSGPRLRGEVLAGGADWITQVSGHSSLDVRIALQTDDDALIYMTYKGIVSPTDNGVYWRVTPLFNTASEKYDWLNHIMAVGKNKQIEGKVAYDIFQVL